jgi:hypothetical protein
MKYIKTWNVVQQNYEMTDTMKIMSNSSYQENLG